jgi:hypothetical protein
MPPSRTISADEGPGDGQDLIADPVGHPCRPSARWRSRRRTTRGGRRDGPPASGCAKRRQCAWAAGCAGTRLWRSRWAERRDDRRGASWKGHGPPSARRRFTPGVRIGNVTASDAPGLRGAPVRGAALTMGRVQVAGWPVMHRGRGTPRGAPYRSHPCRASRQAACAVAAHEGPGLGQRLAADSFRASARWRSRRRTKDGGRRNG